MIVSTIRHGFRRDRHRRRPIPIGERAEKGSRFKDRNFQDNETVMGRVTLSFGPHLFFVQISDEFAELTENLQKMYVNKFAIRETDPLNEGDIVVARYWEDNKLYRAEVTSLDPLTVRFVDYGHSELIHNRARNVYPVLKKILDVPVQGMWCSLDSVLPASGEPWTPEVADWVFGQENITFTVIRWDVAWKVKAYCGEQDLAQKMLDAGLAIASSALVVANISEPVAEMKIGVDKSTQTDHVFLPDARIIQFIQNGIIRFSGQR